MANLAGSAAFGELGGDAVAFRVSDGYRRYVLFLLLIVALFNFVDRQILAVLLEAIKQEFSLSDTELGMLGGVAFAVFYSLLGVPIAWLADRYNRRNIIAIALCLWSAMTAVCGMTTGFVSLFLARVGVGIGEAGGNPPAYSLIADYFPPERRATAMAVIGMGMFGLNEVITLIAEKAGEIEIPKPPNRLRELLPNLQDWKMSIMPIVRGSVIGFVVGVLPGGGGILATVASYSVERKFSKHPERFGTGEIAGVAAPESANNGSSSGAMIPLLTLGIPSNVNVALLLAGLMLHGITPGPMFMKSRPDVFWGLIASMYVGNVMLLILNLPLIGLFTKIAFVPQSILTPIITFLCILGVFLVNNSPTDILVMVFFGAFAYLMKVCRFQTAPFFLGFILGPMVETSFRRCLIVSRGNLSVFFSKPFPSFLLIAAFLIWMSPIILRPWRKRRV